MGLKGQDAIACWGGSGPYVKRGETRVSELECHAMCLRQRLDRLEAKLPMALVEASIAVQKGEKPPDLLKLTTDPLKPEDPKCKRENLSKQNNIGEENKYNEPSCFEGPCGSASKSEDYASEEDEPQLCILRTLAKKEKFLRKTIFDMEHKEVAYMRALTEAEKNLTDLEKTNRTKVCKPNCPGSKSPLARGAQTTSSPKKGNVKQRIQQLEASNKKMGFNLMNLQKEREELSHHAKALTQELRCTQECLGEVQQKDEGLSPNVKEPIRRAADRLRALSNAGEECPCGEPVKCDSCIICSCSDWERDLEGGGDEPQEENPYATHFEKSPRGLTETCCCGCFETSSESECPCGCRDQMKSREAHRSKSTFSCDQTPDATGEFTSDPTTITSTTIPSTLITSSAEDEKTKERPSGCIGDALKSCENFCEMCKCESTQRSDDQMTNKEQKCEICKCFEPDLQLQNRGLCESCECNCTICASRGDVNLKMLPVQIPESMSKQEADSFTCSCERPPEAPPEIEKICKVDKLREGLENMKNRNHALRKILKGCSCLPRIDETTLAPFHPNHQDCPCTAMQGPVKRTTSGLISTVKLLQNKCRTKDGMIVALADELRRGATSAQTNRVFESLADPGLCCRANDFDRCELWKYLKMPLQRSNNVRVSRDVTHGRDLLIGLLVLFLIILSHAIRSYANLPSAISAKYLKLLFSTVHHGFDMLGSFWGRLVGSTLSLVNYFTMLFAMWLSVLLRSSAGVAQRIREYIQLLDSPGCFRSLAAMTCKIICSIIYRVNVVKRFICAMEKYVSALAHKVRNAIPCFGLTFPSPSSSLCSQSMIHTIVFSIFSFFARLLSETQVFPLLLYARVKRVVDFIINSTTYVITRLPFLDIGFCSCISGILNGIVSFFSNLHCDELPGASICFAGCSHTVALEESADHIEQNYTEFLSSALKSITELISPSCNDNVLLSPDDDETGICC